MVSVICIFFMEQPKQDYEGMRVSTEQIHWSEEDPSKLDLEYHDSIGSVRKAVLIGGVLTLVISLTIMAVQFGQPFGDIMILMYLPLLFVGIVGIIGGLGIAKRKPNSIYLCKVFAWSCTVYIFIDLTVMIAMGSFPSFLLVLLFFYGLYILFTLYTSDDVSLIFPKEYRKACAFDIILTVICVSFVVVVVVLIILGLIMMASET